VAVGLGMDAMSAAMAIGVRWHGRGQRLRLAWHMGIFQAVMPIIGWLLGRQLAGILHTWGVAVAAALVMGVGAKMLFEALRSHPGAAAEEVEHAVEEVMHMHPKDPTRGWSLWMLSIATSIDALVVGFSLGVKGRAIWAASAVIGVVAAAMVLAGVAIGKRMGKRFGKPAEIAGAILLIGLGVSFFWM